MAATPKPEVKKGQGPDQLPQGAATDINTAPVGTPPQEPQPIAPQMQAATPADFEPKFVPQSEEDQWITGPTTMPEQAVTAGIGSQDQVSEDIVRNLPLLQQLALDPNAPPQLHSIIDYLVRKAH